MTVSCVQAIPYGAIVEKTVVTGISVYMLFGPQIAVCAVVANVALSLLSRQGEGSWFSKERIVQNFQLGMEWFPLMLGIHVVAGLILFTYRPFVAPAQILFSLLKSSWGISFIKTNLFVNLFIPIFEEVTFRGFLQEKIRDVQHLCGADPNSTTQKTARIVLQTAVYGACHFNEGQRLHNIPNMVMSLSTGCCAGEYTEETKSLWSAITMHSMLNTLMSARVLLVGG